MSVSVETKYQLTKAVEKFRRNKMVFSLLVNNFEHFSETLQKQLGICLDDKKITKKEFRLNDLLPKWFKYWICVRDEYNLLYFGAIVNLSQESDNIEYQYDRETFEDGLEKFPHVLSSYEGLRLWMKKDNGKVFICFEK